jgi:hypothetical protein
MYSRNPVTWLEEVGKSNKVVADKLQKNSNNQKKNKKVLSTKSN